MGFFDLFRGRRRDDEPDAPRERPTVPASVTVIPRASRPGNLGALPEGLPAGEFVFAEQGDEPIAWLARGKDLRALWARLVADFPATGLWPVVGHLFTTTEVHRWLEREFDGPDFTIRPVEDVLRAGLWTTEIYPPDDPADAWRYTFAGLAQGTFDGGAVTLPTPDQVTALVLVPVTRPADVAAQLGWVGAGNYELTGGDVTAVLRSWEDRFGMVVTNMESDTLLVTVATPPTDPAQAELLAREWYAFCPDAIDQGVDDLDALAEVAIHDTWYFWWD
ncbi:MAG: DUF4253 domain-containing protein [Propioniciclava sp.]|uniref:DUF4253 domain-containing protein n=1 Tax=Propioniciclava sp. TaxID=2038686 RepID=UPI0039E22842